MLINQTVNLIPSLTARENVALVTEIARNPMRPEDALEIVGLGHRRTDGHDGNHRRACVRE